MRRLWLGRRPCQSGLAEGRLPDALTSGAIVAGAAAPYGCAAAAGECHGPYRLLVRRRGRAVSRTLPPMAVEGQAPLPMAAMEELMAKSLPQRGRRAEPPRPEKSVVEGDP